MTIETYDSLSGQVALVTGANRGIGRAIAKQLTSLGAEVYVGVRNSTETDIPRARTLQLDVRERAEIQQSVTDLVQESGRLDILVNNAAIGGPSDPLRDVTAGELRETVETNFWGPLFLTQEALPHLQQTDGGRVVNLTSNMGTFDGRMENGGWPAYRLSKAALNSFTLYLAGEHDSEELIVNAAVPGKVKTRMGGPEATRTPAEGAETPVWLTTFKPGAPSGYLWKDRERIEW